MRWISSEGSWISFLVPLDTLYALSTPYSLLQTRVILGLWAVWLENPCEIRRPWGQPGSLAFQPVFKQFSAKPLVQVGPCSFSHWFRPTQLVIHYLRHGEQFSLSQHWHPAWHTHSEPMPLGGEQCLRLIPQLFSPCLCSSSMLRGGPQALPGEWGRAGRESMEDALECDLALFVINQLLKVRKENFNHVLKKWVYSISLDLSLLCLHFVLKRRTVVLLWQNAGHLFTLCSLNLQVLGRPGGVGAVSWGGHVATKEGMSRVGVSGLPPPGVGFTLIHFLSVCWAAPHAKRCPRCCSTGWAGDILLSWSLNCKARDRQRHTW